MKYLVTLILLVVFAATPVPPRWAYAWGYIAGSVITALILTTN